MNIEQIEQAKKKAEELIKYNRDTVGIKDFIERVEESKYLQLFTAHQDSLGLRAEETFDLIGVELIELLKKKLRERGDYISKLDVDDLIK